MNVADNLTLIRQKIQQAEQDFSRDLDAVQLLAVSKTQPIEKIQQAITAGQQHFGENYLQEALKKIAVLKDENIIWHFIGDIQSNKTKAIAEQFAWVHSVSRLKIAERLSAQRPAHLPPLNVCIEVNIDQEASKSGVFPEELEALVKRVMTLSGLKLRGLMAIPKPEPDFELQRNTYQKVAGLQQQLIDQSIALDTLSMGMSRDFVAAIAAGSTIVRVGTAIFGKRY